MFLTRRVITASLLFAIAIPASAQMAGMAAQEKPAPPARLFDGMGTLHHPIATTNSEAQKFFDQGLTLVYAFNHAEAARSFQRAADLDPREPMPHWGIAARARPKLQRSRTTPAPKKQPLTKFRKLSRSKSPRQMPNVPTSTHSRTAFQSIRKPITTRSLATTRTPCAI